MWIENHSKKKIHKVKFRLSIETTEIKAWPSQMSNVIGGYNSVHTHSRTWKCTAYESTGSCLSEIRNESSNFNEAYSVSQTSFTLFILLFIAIFTGI